VLITLPGTETNVTPEREVPIIPKATRNHGLFLSPVKKLSVVAFLEVAQEIYRSTPK
jgi:hypothetical protein